MKKNLLDKIAKILILRFRSIFSFSASCFLTLQILLPKEAKAQAFTVEGYLVSRVYQDNQWSESVTNQFRVAVDECRYAIRVSLNYHGAVKSSTKRPEFQDLIYDGTNTFTVSRFADSFTQKADVSIRTTDVPNFTGRSVSSLVWLAYGSSCSLTNNGIIPTMTSILDGTKPTGLVSISGDREEQIVPENVYFLVDPYNLTLETQGHGGNSDSDPLAFVQLTNGVFSVTSYTNVTGFHLPVEFTAYDQIQVQVDLTEDEATKQVTARYEAPRIGEFTGIATNIVQGIGSTTFTPEIPKERYSSFVDDRIQISEPAIGILTYQTNRLMSVGELKEHPKYLNRKFMMETANGLHSRTNTTRLIVITILVLSVPAILYRALRSKKLEL